MVEHLEVVSPLLLLFRPFLLQNRGKNDIERVMNVVWKQTHIHTQDAHLDGASWVCIPYMVTDHEMHLPIHLHRRMQKKKRIRREVMLKNTYQCWAPFQVAIALQNCHCSIEQQAMFNQSRWKYEYTPICLWRARKSQPSQVVSSGSSKSHVDASIWKHSLLSKCLDSKRILKSPSLK